MKILKVEKRSKSYNFLVTGGNGAFTLGTVISFMKNRFNFPKNTDYTVTRYGECFFNNTAHVEVRFPHFAQVSKKYSDKISLTT